MNFMRPVGDTKESLLLNLFFDTSGAIGAFAFGDSTGISSAVISTILKEVANRIILPLTSRSESKRLCQWGKLAAVGLAQRLNDGEKFRKDEFFEETPTDRSNFEEVVESTLKKVMDTTEEPKVKFMAKLTENVHFDEDLDMDTYRQILKDLDELTYRQLCIIRLAILSENKEVDYGSIGKGDLEQMSQDNRTKLYSISRECQTLADNHYFGPVPLGISKNSDSYFIGPTFGQIPDYTHRLHSLMNLHEIPDGDIEQTFSIWNVRVTQTSG